MNYRNWSKIVTHNPDGEYGHQHHKKTDELVTAVSHENAEHYDKLNILMRQSRLSSLD